MKTIEELSNLGAAAADPFDAWWDANHTLSVCGMADARAIWNAARKEKP